jgi:hypothetical protein
MFDVPNGRNPEQFNKTFEVISDYILKECKNGIACSRSIRDMKIAIIEELNKPEDFNDLVQLAIFNAEVRNLSRKESHSRGS